MEFVRHLLLVLHLLGFGALLGGMFVQFKDANYRVNGPMRDGAGTAFLAGLALVGILEAGDGAVNHAKIGVKLLIGLVVLGLVMANLRKERISPALFFTIFALTITNVVVAVFWASAHGA